MSEDAGSVLRGIRQRHANHLAYRKGLMLAPGAEALYQAEADRGALLDLVDRLATVIREEATWLRWYADKAAARTMDPTALTGCARRLEHHETLLGEVSGGRPEGTG